MPTPKLTTQAIGLFGIQFKTRGIITLSTNVCKEVKIVVNLLHWQTDRSGNTLGLKYKTSTLAKTQSFHLVKVAPLTALVKDE